MKKLFRKLVPRSIRGRLSLLFSLVFGAALVLTSFVCFKIFTHAHLSDFDSFLFNHAVDLASTVNPEHDYHGQGITLFDPPDERKKHRLFSVERTYAQLSDENGNVLGRSPTLTGPKSCRTARKTTFQLLLWASRIETLTESISVKGKMRVNPTD